MGEDIMTSILPQIYDALDNMTVSYTDRNGATATPTVYDLDELPGSVETAHLPCRLLMPLGQGRSGTPNLVLGPGNMAQAAWQVTDLFLLETMARTEGAYVHAPVLMRYVTAYAAALANKWQILYQWQTEALTSTAAITPGIYEYPAGSGVYFYGVKVDININETI
jgi:hypothetical protein